MKDSIVHGLHRLNDFSETTAAYVFYSLFESLPSTLELSQVNKNFYKNLDSVVKLDILYGVNYIKLTDLYYQVLVSKDNYLVVIFSENNNNKLDVYYDYNRTSKDLIKNLIKLANKHTKRYKKTVQAPKINLVVSGRNDITTISREFKHKKLTKEELEIHYGTKFLTVYNKLLEFLDKDKGLVLLHGEPGTGKSTIIKQLIADSLKDRMLYLSPESISCIGNPTFTKFLINYPNSTLLAEDAECVLMKQEFREQATTNLLNLTDGLLASILSTKIIATFNTEISKLDSALLRPGRLYLKYEFNKLTVEESNRFLEYYKSTNRVSKDSTLAELFTLV